MARKTLSKSNRTTQQKPKPGGRQPIRPSDKTAARKRKLPADYVKMREQLKTIFMYGSGDAKIGTRGVLRILSEKALRRHRCLSQSSKGRAKGGAR